MVTSKTRAKFTEEGNYCRLFRGAVGYWIGQKMNTGLLAVPKGFRHCYAISLAVSLALASGVMADVNIGVNVQGLSQPSSTVLEPDISGAAGPDTYAEFVNGAFGVFSKTTGAISAQSTDQAFWENAGISASALSSGASNPRLIYDSNSGRWFATEITNSSPGNGVLLAV